MTTPQQRRFVTEYLRDFNATRAAERAGYSPRSARHYGAKLARRPALLAEIERIAAQRETRILVDGERVVAELMRLAFSDIRDFLEAAGGTERLKPLDALSTKETAAIAALRPGDGARGPTLRLHAKTQALRALARHVGLNERRHAADPRLLVAETRRVREKVLRAAGLDPDSVLPPPQEE